VSAIAAIAAANRQGRHAGIASWCTAHEATLLAILRAHRGSDEPILIEATCNQVNQHGGYTGMTPKDFRAFVERLAVEAGVSPARLILGGDHLGPNPWKSKPAAEAMAEARRLVQDYVAAGFTKIHLDASMACADDGNLAESEMADRAADLCAAAEALPGAAHLNYIIGTEVPIPGGETEVLDTLAVTRPESASRTVDLHREAFARRGLQQAFARVAGLVVQPGVDFGNSQVFGYAPARAASLVAANAALPGLVYEAHSTDYQTGEALRGLVAGHFAILKVGPELTFAYREAILAMAAIESWLDVKEPSGVLAAIRKVMDEQPGYWRGYVPSGEPLEETRFFGLSDRIRYYWPQPPIAEAVARLRANIDGARVTIGLLSQYVGAMADAPPGAPLSQRIIQHKVGAVVAKYRSACGSFGQ
jgi:D-tagatose-bisphosphate aldolase class II non-catalytic subunit